jgi:hypothetical protein
VVVARRRSQSWVDQEMEWTVATIAQVTEEVTRDQARFDVETKAVLLMERARRDAALEEGKA